MKIFYFLKDKLIAFKNFIFRIPLKIKLLIGVILIASVWFGRPYVVKLFQSKKITYQITKAAKGTLTTSITGSGTISSGNSTNITTAATGTITQVYVINGDKVTKGQKIAELLLDEYGQEQQASAWSNYIDTLNNVKVAEQAKVEDDVKMWEAHQAMLTAQDDIDYKNINKINSDTKKEYTLSEKAVIDKTLEKAKKAFLTYEDKYKTADAAILKAKAKVTAAWRDYEEVSATITAPIAGTVNNLSLAAGVIISSSSTSKTATSTTTSSSSTDTSNTITSQKIGKIYNTEGQLQATVNLNESDVINVASNQKVTLTLDAYSDKTFTGKVLAVDTSGSVSSGVTTYPVTILLDKTEVGIYPNMAVAATIITDVKTDVLLVSSAVIDTENNKSVVHILKNNKVTDVEVTTGSSDDTQTEITKGLSEGDVVITNYTSANDASENNESSAFSSTSKTNSSKSSTKSSGSSMGGGMPGGGGPGGM